MTDAILAITNGTTRVDLINPSSGFHLVSWNPAITNYKGGGVFQNPPLADWRQLRVGKWDTATEPMELHVNGANPNGAATILQQLRQLLEEANQYWTTDWQNNPVWVEAKAKCETNIRYAVIVKGRLASDRNYFDQPFTGQIATMQNLPLQIERRAWLSNQPGTGTATNISAVQYYDSQWCVNFAAATDEIDCGSDAGIDDLPAGANGFTAEAWVKALDYGIGSATAGFIFMKRTAATNGWNLGINESALGIVGLVVAATTNARSVVNFAPDSQWHHIAMVYDDNAASRVVRIFIDGVEGTYTEQTPASGAYGSDAAANMFIGNHSFVTSFAWNGCVAWCRLSDTARYTGSFTPDDLCSQPAVDGNTVAQWNMTEGSGATVDNVEGTAASDGTITGATWASDPNYEGCGRAYGNVDSSGDREVTTANEVYIANKHNLANLTDIYNFDASGASFSSNLLDAALPTELFPNPAAASDIVYFGINTALPDSGPFCSLVFDIATAAAATTSFTLVWEYWNGAWVTLTTQDNTDSFQETDVNSVHWEQPGDWATTSINGVTAYWVRVRISALTGTFTNPTQQNRNIYSIVWPYVEIQASEVDGDIPALNEIKLTVASDADGPIGSAPDLYSNRIIGGLRSVLRGSDFSAFLNCADEQNNPNIDVTVGTNCSFGPDPRRATGREVLWIPVVLNTMEDRVLFTINKPLAKQYYGRYHAYIFIDVSGLPTSFGASLRIRVKTGTAGVSYSGESQVPNTTSNLNITMDLGEIVILPPSGNIDDDIDKLEIAIQGSITSALASILFFELILIPTDESVFESIDNQNDNESTVENGRYLKVSSLYPKKHISSTINETINGDVLGQYGTLASGPAILQKSSRQRIWFLSSQATSVGSSLIFSPIEISYLVNLTRNQRYLSLRGEN